MAYHHRPHGQQEIVHPLVGFPAYAQGAALVDPSAAPSVRAAVQELERAGFLRAPEGTSVTSRVLQLVREAQP